MRAGQLNRRLHLQKLTSAADTEGFTAEGWADLAVVWGAIDPIQARETYSAAQSLEDITHQITIRWRTDISPRMRFLYSPTQTGVPRIFLIHRILNPNEDLRELNCLCEEFVTTQVGAA